MSRITRHIWQMGSLSRTMFSRGTNIFSLFSPLRSHFVFIYNACLQNEKKKEEEEEEEEGKRKTQSKLHGTTRRVSSQTEIH